MTNKEALEIVLKLAKANTLAEHDIMYAQQEAQASLEKQAIEVVEALFYHEADKAYIRSRNIKED
tara:strand:- start:68 stop:262 length:195 start_codon:yes stop_codon:yes gene_type:complete